MLNKFSQHQKCQVIVDYSFKYSFLHPFYFQNFEGINSDIFFIMFHMPPLKNNKLLFVVFLGSKNDKFMAVNFFNFIE